MDEARLQDVAGEAAAAGGRVLRAAWSGPRHIRRKADVDLVTDADLAAERAILDVIRAACPDDRVLTEESGVHAGASGRCWIIDPLDGTTNFAHGNPHVAVSIAVEQSSELLAGVVHDPFRRETFRAERGRGAWLGDTRLRVSPTRSVGDALVATGFPYDRRHEPGRYLHFVARVLERCQGIRRGGSAALDLAWLAAGRLDAYWEWRLAPWDVAAGRLLVEEAHGTVTAADGSPHRLDHPSIVATNGILHDAFLRVLSWNGTVP